MKNKTTIKPYVKPNAFCMQISPCSLLSGSTGEGTEGYVEKPGQGEWTVVNPDEE